MRLVGESDDLSIEDATPADIEKATAPDFDFGTFIRLEQSDETYMQAAGGDDAFDLEYRDGSEDQHFSATGEVTREQLRAALLAYLAGEDGWKTAHAWERLDMRSGCLGLLLAVLVGL